jgi:hypothetical protein
VKEKTDEEAVIASVSYVSVLHAFSERSTYECDGNINDTFMIDRLLSDKIPVYYIPSGNMEKECVGFEKYDMTDLPFRGYNLYKIEGFEET